MTRKVTAVVGARPNYMKVAPVWRELAKRGRLSHEPCAHRPALRRKHVEGLLRRPEASQTRCLSRGRIRSPRRTDGEGDDRAREGVLLGRARSPRRRRRRELDDGGGARRGQDGDPRRARRGGAPEFRPHDARGDQPDGHGHRGRSPLHHRTERREESSERRRRSVQDPLRRKRDDRQPSLLPADGGALDDPSTICGSKRGATVW